MAERRGRFRSFWRWGLTVAIVAYAISQWGGGPTGDAVVPDDDRGGSPSLRITSISDGDVNPGDAIVVRFDGADPATPIDATVAKHAAEVLVRNPRSLVVRVPVATARGKAPLRLHQGARRSKAWDLQVRPPNHRKRVARLLGGLALFVYGLGLFALGARGLAGHRVRALLGRLTRSPPKAVGVGVLVGGVTQLTSSAAAFTVSLVEARLVPLRPTIAIFVGAQLGAAVTGALIPVQLAGESLLVIAIGVLWTRLATSRRSGAIARLVLGTGLMLYGLHLLQTSVEPLVGDPKLLPYLGYLRAAGPAALLTCAATGVVLAFVLQGPGPVYVLVVGLARASGALPLANALGILAGTNLGAALGMALIAWQAGPATRPLVRPHLSFGVVATVLAVASAPVCAAVAGWIVPGHGAALDYGHTVVRASIAAQLAVGFAIAEIAVVGAWLAVLPALIARVSPRARPADIAGPAPGADGLALTAQAALARVLGRQAFAVDTALETSCAAERAGAAECEEALVDARRTLEVQYAAIGAASAVAGLEQLARTLVAALQLQRVVEQLVNVAELGVERGLRLTPDEQRRLRAMHALARTSFDVAIASLERGEPPDLEAAGAREIRMNLLEAEGRSVSAVAHRKNDSASVQLGIAELIDSYEHVGNHLYRVCKALGDEGEELA